MMIDEREPNLSDSSLGSENAVASRSKSSPKFFLLVFVLSIPFGLAGALTRLELLPGLPLSSLMWVCPAIAASILVYRENKIEGVIELLKRAFDYPRIKEKVWYAPTILLMPGVTVLAYAVMRLKGWPLPAPQFSVLAALMMFVTFFVCALGEELGWSGYVIDPLQDRRSALQASVLLGLVWAAWHLVPLIQADRSPEWIGWWSLYTAASRILMTWLYNNTGKSVFAAALYHDMSNLSWQLFPNHGSHWEPRVVGLITAFAAAIVTVVWGPRTLARCREMPE